MKRKVTALTAQQRNPRRVNVYLDDEFAFGLERVTAAWLQIGQELSEEKVAELQAKDAVELACQQALKLINHRPRSEAEIRRNLERHKVSDEIITEALEHLRRNELVDDARFAQTWVENRSDFRPRSRKALRMEMHQRGLDDVAISQALSDVNDEDLAYRAALKHSRRLREAEWPDFRQKLTDFLIRRGFAYSTAASIVKRIWDERTSGDIELNIER
jgi:regulatory protein